jgi:hypothetical protein
MQNDYPKYIMSYGGKLKCLQSVLQNARINFGRLTLEIIREAIVKGEK